MPNKEEQKHINTLRRRRKLRQLLGAVVCLLVVAGLVSVVTGSVELYKKLTDDTEERAAFAERVSTLVAFDPVPFDNLAEADQNLLLEACIWRVLDAEDTSGYEQDEVGAKFMPVSVVDKYVQELYGPDFKFAYETFTSGDLTYFYDEERAAYLVPITGLTANFYPEAVKIKNEHGTKRVTMAYISSYNANGGFTATPDLTPKKYYDFIFTKIENGYYLTAIVESKMKAPETAPASSSNSTPAVVAAEDNQNLLTDATLTDSIPTTSEAISDSVAPEDATIGVS